MTPERQAKFDEMVKCFEEKNIVKGIKWDNVTCEGLISRTPERYSGIWGYGGDSVAIYIDNEPFPLSGVTKLN